MEKRGNTCRIKKIIILWMVSLLLFMAVATEVCAIDLVDEDSSAYQEIYGAGGTDSEDEGLDSYENTEDDVLGVLLGALFAWLGRGINKLFESGNLDLSIDGIVYGRLNTESSVRMDVAHFGLEENNPYGIMGASIYYILRDFAFAVVPVVVLIMLIIQFFHNTQKGRARLKEVIENTIVFFISLMIVPYLIEFYIYVRDVCMYLTGSGLRQLLVSIGGEDVNIINNRGIFAIAWASYSNSWSLVDGLMVFGISLAGLFYLWDYVKIAAMLTLSFGLFPILLIIRFFKPKVFQDWWDIMIPSLLIPFLDMIMLMLPSVISIVYTSVYGSNIGLFSTEVGSGVETRDGSMALVFIMLCCTWAARPIRDKIMQKIFGFDGSIRGSGSPIMAIMMLARAFGSKGGSRESGSGKTSTSTESLEKAAEQKEYGEALADADKRIDGMNVPDVPERVGIESRDSGVEQFLKEQEEAAELATVNAEALEESGGMDDMGGAGEVLRETPDTVSDMEELGQGVEAVSTEEMAEMCTEVGSRPSDSEVAPGMEDNAPDTVGVIDSVGNTPRMALNDVVIPSSQDSPNYSKYVNSDTFAGMSERDKKRFHNLSKLDALEHSVRKNEQIMAKAGYVENGFEEKYSSEKLTNGKLRQAEERLLNARNQINDTSSDAYRTADASYQRAAELRQGSDKRLVHMEAAQRAAYENEVYNQHIEHCKGVESAYARNSERAGMSGRTYYDVGDYYYSKKVETIAKKHANFRNFESGKFDSILSPQEKEEFYRQRSVYQEREKVVRAAAMVGGAAAGVVGGAAAMYGGPSATGMGVAVGFGLGSTAVNSAGMPLASANLSKESSDNRKEETRRAVRSQVDVPKEQPVYKEGGSSFESAYEKVNRQADKARDEIEG